MRNSTLFDPQERFDGCWPTRLLISDGPENWAMLVEQIVELDELLAEVIDGFDDDAAASADQLRRLLASKRDRLRTIDVEGEGGPGHNRR